MSMEATRKMEKRVVRGDVVSRPDAGVALFVALMMLLVFSMLGTAYVRYMNLELTETQAIIQKLRGKHLGQSGIYAAIGEIEAAKSRNEAPAASYEFDMPIYRTQKADDGVSFEMGVYGQQVTASVSDESGLVNLNHAPEELLVALGVPKTAVMSRHSRDARPFVAVDDLRARSFMNGQEYSALDKSTLTVYTGDSGGANVNLNSAGTKVLAAIFNISAAEAQALAGKRPFTSWDDVVDKVGKAPTTYRVKGSGSSMPAGLSLSSDTYRILSTALMQTPDTTRNGVHVDVEAVVSFRGEGFAIRFWTETPAEITYTRDTVNAEAVVSEFDGDEESPAEDSVETDAASEEDAPEADEAQ